VSGIGETFVFERGQETALQNPCPASPKTFSGAERGSEALETLVHGDINGRLPSRQL
jgi:hypothetical protein